VQRSAPGEYLNLFLSGPRAMLFWVPPLGPPVRPFNTHLPVPHPRPGPGTGVCVARCPGRCYCGSAEVAFEGRSPGEPWWVPAEDTLRRAEGLALLEEYVRTGAVPSEIPPRAAPACTTTPRQLLLFGDAEEFAPEPRTVRWEPWGRW
jgi:hypothetical protein